MFTYENKKPRVFASFEKQSVQTLVKCGMKSIENQVKNQVKEDLEIPLIPLPMKAILLLPQ